MFHFQSKHKTHDLCGTPVIQFRNYEFSTDDPKVAERVRRNCGQDIWEDHPELYQSKEQQVETPQAKKRGRPPKVQVVDGMRMAEVKGEGQ